MTRKLAALAGLALLVAGASGCGGSRCQLVEPVGGLVGAPTSVDVTKVSYRAQED